MFILHVLLFVFFFSSWCRSISADYDCGTSWTFLLTFFHWFLRLRFLYHPSLSFTVSQLFPRKQFTKSDEVIPRSNRIQVLRVQKIGLSPIVIYSWPLQCGASGVFYSNCRYSSNSVCFRFFPALFKKAWWLSAEKQLSSRHSVCTVLYFSGLLTKPSKWYMHPAKTHISLGIRPIWSESSLCTQWVAKDPSFLHADSEDSDQTGRMPRLIWVVAGRTGLFVGFAMLWLILCRP